MPTFYAGMPGQLVHLGQIPLKRTEKVRKTKNIQKNGPVRGPLRPRTRHKVGRNPVLVPLEKLLEVQLAQMARDLKQGKNRKLGIPTTRAGCERETIARRFQESGGSFSP